MKDKELFFFAPSENIEGEKDKKLWYWQECMKIAAESGAKMGTLVFWVVYKIAVYEEHGKFDFCTAGPARLAEDLEVSEKQIRWALQRACSTSVWQGRVKKSKKQQLYHIFCSQRVYRNKTGIYVTKHWLEKHNIKSDKISILAHNKHPEQMLDKENERYKVLPAKEDVEKSVVLSDEEADITTPKSVDFDETTSKSVDTTPKSVVDIEVDLNSNKSNGMSESLNESKSSSKEDVAEPLNKFSKTRKRKIFVPPTVEEVRTYCEEKGYSIDPEFFVEYYEAGGWKDKNGSPVKSWKQRVVTWSKHSSSQTLLNSKEKEKNSAKREREKDEWYQGF